MAGWLDDLTPRWSGARVLVVGHVATRWALDHHLDGVPLETLTAADFAWQPGWEYQVTAWSWRGSRSGSICPPAWPCSIKSETMYDSAIVDPYGRILQRAIIPEGGRATLIADVPLGTADSIFIELGPWFGWGTLPASIGLRLAARRQLRHARPSHDHETVPRTRSRATLGATRGRDF